ncbi:MAG TPA: serine/threonine-protein kinase [Polyangiaceae bacterium]|jgi:serine/threonine-protein kinase
MSEEGSNTLPAGTLLAGKFRVVRCLGEGGMGAVYEIEHELTKHRRALKLLHAAMASMPSVVERFLREASAAGRVGNPHIVESFDAGTLDTGEPYLVLEMLRGETLSDRIARSPMSLLEIVDLIGQACDGIQAAHDAGIVHRDLKPDNLFIIEQDGRPFVKILDFGISKFDPSKTGGMQLTQAGAALGTPYYMPPEQIRGETNLDARADIYALGVILYECAAAKRPFEADTLPQLAILIHTGRPRRLSEYRADLPEPFIDLVHRAMATERDARIQTASELAFALERFGSISFRAGQTARSMLPLAPSTTARAQSLATSGAGVSMHQALSPGKKSSALPLVLGGIGLVAVAGVIAVALHKPAPPPTATLESATTVAATAPSAPAAPQTAAPAGSEAPAASASAVASAGKPVVAPTIERVAPAQPNVSPGQAPPPTAPGPAPRKSGRADERGLAKDNPFK